MKVFVAGATGAIGRELVPRLVEAGHEVHRMTRKDGNRAILEEMGAVPVVADALDAGQVAAAVDLGGSGWPRHELARGAARPAARSTARSGSPRRRPTSPR